MEAGLVLGALALTVGAGSLLTRTASASADHEVATEDARRVLRATEAWASDTSQQGCPTLSTLKRDGLLSEDAPTDDPWGERFRVVCGGDDGPVVRSYGRDGVPRTDDDIVVAPGT
jgi:hypothetical protein